MAKNRILYVIALIGLALFYVYCNSYMPIMVIIMLLTITVFSILLVLVAKKALFIEAVPKQSNALQGSDEPAEIEVVINNKSYFPIPIVLLNIELCDLSESAVIKRKIITSVALGERKSVALSFGTDHSAAIECRITKARCFDAFGLFGFRVKNLKTTSKLVIMPRILPESFIKPAENLYIIDSDTYSDTQKGDDSSQVFEVRNYVPGDDIRRIHWGLSLKQDDLIVKEFSKPIAEACVVILETGLVGDNGEALKIRMDNVLSVFITLADELITNEQTFTVKWFNSEKSDIASYEVKSSEEVYPVITEYLSQTFSEKQNVSLTISEEFENMVFEKQIYYLYDSNCCDEDLINELGEKFCLIDVKDKLQKWQGGGSC